MNLPVTHELFDQDAEMWWSKNSHCALLASIVPVRLDYLRRIFAEEYGNDFEKITVLDVGCGGGLFTEEVARLGYQVTGVDLSPRSIMIAQRHADQMGLPITYRVSSGEELPFENNTFNVVYCCDVLEHVSDLNTVIAQSARVLEVGGLYLFDTINRTWLSKLLMITLVQDWLRVAPQNLHDWKKFITPTELHTLLVRHGLEPRDMIGMMPDMHPFTSLKRLVSFLKLKRGKMTYAELGREMVFQTSRFKFMNFMGYAIKSKCRS
jgi:2-polyprenyl-6-hydroxyphenyl methylase/3-demethylubiquinone-9 3-methyltransferase